MIRRPRPRVKLSRREIFARDRHTCQYCGRQTHDLTLDHVVPRHRGGGHTWENLVTACKSCNHRKGGKTLEEARLRLHRAAVRAAQRPLLAVHAVPRRRAQRGLADVPVPGPELTRRAGARPTRSGASRAPIPDAGPRTSLRDALGGRPCRLRRRRLAARRRCSARRPRDWDLATAALPEQTPALFAGRRLREPRSGRSRSARDDAGRGRDHDVPHRPRLRRLPAAAPGRVRRRRSSSTSPAATSR